MSDLAGNSLNPAFFQLRFGYKPYAIIPVDVTDDRTKDGRTWSMKHLRDKFVRYMVYGGISKQEYKEIEDEILEKDRSSLCATAGCVA